MTTVESTEEHPEHPELSAWALDCCDEARARQIEEHVHGCPLCAAEAPRLRAAATMLAAATPVTPPAPLRHRVLASALARRPSRQRLVEPYARQVTALDTLLSELDSDQLLSTEPHYGTVRAVLAHLAGNDSLVAEDLGLIASGVGAPTHQTWHGQAMRLLRGVEVSAPLDKPVRMAGKAQLWRPLRDALVQRTFETWIHADDVRRAVARPSAPPPAEDLSLIIALGLRLLPMALRAQGLERPGHAAMLELAGVNPTMWRVPLAMHSDGGVVVVTVRTDAVAFCELMANRQLVDTFAYESVGDGSAALDLLRAAATLGCD